MTLEAKNLGTPDQKRSFEHGATNVVTIAGAIIVRAVFNPGWRWSTDVKPAAETGSCQVRHTSYVVSGRFAVRMDDGTEGEFGPGDACVAGPGHDAWVVGDEPCVLIDLAQPTGIGAQMARCHPCGVEFRAPDGGSGSPPHRGRPGARQRLARARRQPGSTSCPNWSPADGAAGIRGWPAGRARARPGCRRSGRPDGARVGKSFPIS